MRLSRRVRVALFVAAAAAVPVVVVLVTGRWMGRPRLHGPETTELAAYAYPKGETACAAGSRNGSAGRSDEESTGRGIPFSVRTPVNYDPTRAHPLIVVHAPHGADRRLVERFAGLTRTATGAGFVVAYADSRPLTPESIAELATIPEAVASRWCVDRTRVYLTGHSDGGTVSEVVAFRSLGGIRPAAIAPSAAGVRGEDLERETCPPPLSVRVSHGTRDRLFPDYGAGAALWWAKCNGCSDAAVKRRDGCAEYPGCRAGVVTLYCEHDGRHAEWPDGADALVRFFQDQGR